MLPYARQFSIEIYDEASERDLPKTIKRKANKKKPQHTFSVHI